LFQAGHAFSYQLVTDEKGSFVKKKIIKPSEVDKVAFNIYENRNTLGQSTYEGYILFKDKFGHNCAVTSGKPLYVWIGQQDEPPFPNKTNLDFYQELTINPSQFKIIKIRTGDIVYCVPINSFIVRYKTDRSAESVKDVHPLFKMYWESDFGKKWKRKVRPY